MQLVGTDIKTIAFIESDTEFNRAKIMGFWDAALGLMTKRNPNLTCFETSVENLECQVAVKLGLQDIPLKRVVGSVGRSGDFSRSFLPRVNNVALKERWRKIYTLAVTGAGFPPVEIYKVGDDYFVEDGHHRVSVARYLGWETIQANVTKLHLSPACDPALKHQLELCKGVNPCS
jgi:hypothetical protein